MTHATRKVQQFLCAHITTCAAILVRSGPLNRGFFARHREDGRLQHGQQEDRRAASGAGDNDEAAAQEAAL